ncbi:MAG TPA: 4-demethylwyosine synthase TYW1 [Candidatus Diapherotrites archaeon]|uniref:4-demethylwyosine synthase TYW1 n=1 Tax=Candidatus Iainarchaeum sp. TaxID=3101447 RepID=A0A7J4IZJ7_9ARCH|nr:4-demethylwyosine synthase TYW1 [Candidatus Diapherotrites archaeon]
MGIVLDPERATGHKGGRIAVKCSNERGADETKYLSPAQVSKLGRAKYAIVGSHSAVQICTWNKKALRKEGVCYKQKFYGIECSGCAQMSPSVLWCNENCVFCWRPMEWMRSRGLGGIETDSPRKIIEGTIGQRKKLLTGFGGLEKVSRKRFENAQMPTHWAISLSGEPTLYPQICELISQLKSLPATKSVFLVTNAQKTEVFEKMARDKKFLPTQLYVSLDAPNEEMFKKINRSVLKDGWQRLLGSMEVISGLKTRKVVRITLMHEINDDMKFLAEWSGLIWAMKPEFLEVKSYMHIGDSRSRLSRDNMLLFEEIEKWCNEFGKVSGYVCKDYSRPSRIVLMVRPDLRDRSTKIEFARKEMGIGGEGIDF